MHFFLLLQSSQKPLCRKEVTSWAYTHRLSTVHQIYLWVSTSWSCPNDMSPNEGREVGHEKGWAVPRSVARPQHPFYHACTYWDNISQSLKLNPCCSYTDRGLPVLKRAIVSNKFTVPNKSGICILPKLHWLTSIFKKLFLSLWKSI